MKKQFKEIQYFLTKNRKNKLTITKISPQKSLQS